MHDMQRNVRQVVLLVTATLFLASSCLGQSSDNNTYERYAEGIFKRYDTDQDGFLSKSEVKRMRRPPQNADSNIDGRISKAELAASIIPAKRKTTTTNPSPAQSNQNNTEEPISFGIQFNLLEIENGSSLEQLENQVQKLNTASSSKEISRLVSELRKMDGILNYDTYSFRSMIGRHEEVESFRDSIYNNSRNGSQYDGLKLQLNSVQPNKDTDLVELNLLLFKQHPEVDEEQEKEEIEIDASALIAATAFARNSNAGGIADAECEGPITIMPNLRNGKVTLLGSQNDIKQIQQFVDNKLATRPNPKKALRSNEYTKQRNRDDKDPTLKSLKIQTGMACKIGGASAMLISNSNEHWILAVHISK